MGKQAVRSMQTSGLVMLCLITVACTQENAEEPPPITQADSKACESALREVLGLEFTAPDREVTRIKLEIFNQMAEETEGTDGLVEHPGYEKGDPELDAFYEYAAEMYEPYFNENGYTAFTDTRELQAFEFHEPILEYRIEPTSISVNKIEMEEADENFSAFNFNLTANYQTRFDESFYDFTGWALCTTEGKIAHLTLIDREDLAAKMSEYR